jgi:hypothetical protein
VLPETFLLVHPGMNGYSIITQWIFGATVFTAINPSRLSPTSKKTLAIEVD